MMPSKIAFYFESGVHVGTGHEYRVKSIDKELRRRGYETLFIGKEDPLDDIKILVIDHLYSQKDLILKAKNLGIKTVLIDGFIEDASLVDVSISVLYNPRAKYKGLNFISFPSKNEGFDEKYTYDEKNKAVFIGMGGYDKNNYTELILNILVRLNLCAIVAPGINDFEVKEKFKDNKNINFGDDKDYYKLMSKCVVAITGGGLTMFQALYFGMPCVCVPQYDHQRDNINLVKNFCLFSEPNEKDIEDNLKKLITNKHLCYNLSDLAKINVDGKGTGRICDLVIKTMGWVDG